MVFVLYKADKYKYVKLLEEMENDFLQKKDLFPKTVTDMCRVLAGWKNTYGGKYNRFAEANDGVAFTMTTSDEPKNKCKKKNITCFKCNKKGHYSNKCEENNKDTEVSKKGSNFLVMRQKKTYLKQKTAKKAVQNQSNTAIMMMTQIKMNCKGLLVHRRTFYALYKMSSDPK